MSAQWEYRRKEALQWLDQTVEVAELTTLDFKEKMEHLDLINFQFHKKSYSRIPTYTYTIIS